MFGNPAVQPNSKPEIKLVAFVTGTSTASKNR